MAKKTVTAAVSATPTVSKLDMLHKGIIPSLALIFVGFTCVTSYKQFSLNASQARMQKELDQLKDQMKDQLKEEEAKTASAEKDAQELREFICELGYDLQDVDPKTKGLLSVKIALKMIVEKTAHLWKKAAEKVKAEKPDWYAYYQRNEGQVTRNAATA